MRIAQMKLEIVFAFRFRKPIGGMSNVAYSSTTRHHLLFGHGANVRSGSGTPTADSWLGGVVQAVGLALEATGARD